MLTIEGVQLPLSKNQFLDSMAVVKNTVNVHARLPQWPFSRPAGHVALCEFTPLLGDQFEPVLVSLAAAHGDSEVILAVLEPDDYQTTGALYPAFRITLDALVRRRGWWEALNYEPDGKPPNAFVDTADVVVVVGDSGRWTVWGERYWETAVLHTDIREGAWLHAGVPFRSAEFAYDHWIHPSWSNRPLKQDERSAFVEIFRNAVLTEPEE